MQALRLIIPLAVVVAVVIFGVKNMAPITLNYYRGEVELPLFFALLVAFVPGFVCAWLLTIWERAEAKREARGGEAQVKELEREIKELKEQPTLLSEQGMAAPTAEKPSWSFREGEAQTEEPRSWP